MKTYPALLADLATKFGQPTQQGDLLMYKTRDARVRVFAQSFGMHCRVGVAYEQRPGVWFNLGDMGHVVNAQPILAALGVTRCSVRTPIDDVEGYVAALQLQQE